LGQFSSEKALYPIDEIVRLKRLDYIIIGSWRVPLRYLVFLLNLDKQQDISLKII